VTSGCGGTLAPECSPSGRVPNAINVRQSERVGAGALDPRTRVCTRVRLAPRIACSPRCRAYLCAHLEPVYLFKSWNDNYGHASGDALLRELAVLLRAAATDPADLVARNGGDEFCVVFADAEKSSAIVCAERLRASIAEADFRGLHAPVSGGEEVRISASIGVACFPVDAPSPQELLEKADEAMCHSKKTGRNGVSFFGVDKVLVRANGAAEERTADRRRE
jgi:diguanylate cyclase (GGDEF)-like protein